jgi:hypothetical protein
MAKAPALRLSADALRSPEGGDNMLRNAILWVLDIPRAQTSDRLDCREYNCTSFYCPGRR